MRYFLEIGLWGRANDLYDKKHGVIRDLGDRKAFQLRLNYGKYDLKLDKKCNGGRITGRPTGVIRAIDFKGILETRQQNSTLFLTFEGAELVANT